MLAVPSSNFFRAKKIFAPPAPLAANQYWPNRGSKLKLTFTLVNNWLMHFSDGRRNTGLNSLQALEITVKDRKRCFESAEILLSSPARQQLINQDITFPLSQSIRSTKDWEFGIQWATIQISDTRMIILITRNILALTIKSK